MLPQILAEELVALAAGRFYYVGSPYTHPDPAIRDWRAREVHRYSGLLMAQGIYAFATIHMTHEIAKSHNLPTDFEWWIGYNKAFIDPSAGMIIAHIEGWDESKGLAQEINYCRSISLPIYLASDTGAGSLVITKL